LGKEGIRINLNKVKIYFLFFFLICSFSQQATAYILNQTKAGLPVHWSGASSTVDIFVNSDNTQGLSSATVQSIAATSLAQWNGVTQIAIRKNITLGKNQPDLNELYFSTDPSVFNGTGVIGITQVGFKELSGEIVEADILVNDNFTFSAVTTSQYYLGNVITHEAGHFLGLGHGQVAGSTMFYALSRGQHTIEPDDRAGLYALYPSGNPTLGSLSGTIVGGKNLAAVFGTHVQAISVKKGIVAGASISEINGKFTIQGLPIDDQYVIYTSPIVQLGLPSNYANVKSDFCESSKKYRGSFFQSCGSSSEGFPQAVKMIGNSLDMGNITIRCGLDSPPEYFQKKGITPAEFEVNNYTTSGLGGSFVGFFSNAEMQSGIAKDYFRLNFSNILNWNTVSNNPSLFLELKVLNQTFYSAFKANISVKRSSGSTDIVPKVVQASDGRYSLETIAHIPINRADSSDNDFEISVLPEAMDGSFPAGIPYSKVEYFPSYAELQDNVYFYLATATIVKDNGDGTYSQVVSKNDIVTDNTHCPDAINTYALTNYTAKGTSSQSDRKKSAGCGTVDMNNGAGGGPGGFMVGLILSFIVAYALSRYSKMA
jgi:predicted Zn-dependent protease